MDEADNLPDDENIFYVYQRDDNPNMYVPMRPPPIDYVPMPPNGAQPFMPRHQMQPVYMPPPPHMHPMAIPPYYPGFGSPAFIPPLPPEAFNNFPSQQYMFRDSFVVPDERYPPNEMMPGFVRAPTTPRQQVRITRPQGSSSASRPQGPISSITDNSASVSSSPNPPLPSCDSPRNQFQMVTNESSAGSSLLNQPLPPDTPSDSPRSPVKNDTFNSLVTKASSPGKSSPKPPLPPVTLSGSPQSPHRMNKGSSSVTNKSSPGRPSLKIPLALPPIINDPIWNWNLGMDNDSSSVTNESESNSSWSRLFGDSPTKPIGIDTDRDSIMQESLTLSSSPNPTLPPESLSNSLVEPVSKSCGSSSVSEDIESLKPWLDPVITPHHFSDSPQKPFSIGRNRDLGLQEMLTGTSSPKPPLPPESLSNTTLLESASTICGSSSVNEESDSFISWLNRYTATRPVTDSPPKPVTKESEKFNFWPVPPLKSYPSSDSPLKTVSRSSGSCSVTNENLTGSSSPPLPQDPLIDSLLEPVSTNRGSTAITEESSADNSSTNYSSSSATNQSSVGCSSTNPGPPSDSLCEAISTNCINYSITKESSDDSFSFNQPPQPGFPTSNADWWPVDMNRDSSSDIKVIPTGSSPFNPPLPPGPLSDSPPKPVSMDSGSSSVASESSTLLSTPYVTDGLTPSEAYRQNVARTGRIVRQRNQDNPLNQAPPIDAPNQDSELSMVNLQEETRKEPKPVAHNPEGALYKSKTCVFWKAGKCKRGVKCNFSHDEDKDKPTP